MYRRGPDFAMLESMTRLPLLGILLGAQAPPDDPLQPYTGPSVKGVDPSTLDGKVLCGYPGWFSAEGEDPPR